MATIWDDDFALLVCTNPSDPEADASHGEILISTEDILSWDLSNVLRYSIVKIKANRKRLAEQSSYFQGLLCGNFSESTSECILIEWNLESLLRVLMCVYGFQVVITSKSLLPLLEGALYFGVDALLLRCKTWCSEVISCKGTGLPQIELDDLFQLWNFSLLHELDFFPELCVSYLSRNFMYAVSDQCFVDVPFALLLSSLKHPHLTVDSEMHLAEAVLLWIHANSESLKFQGWTKDNYMDIFRQIRVCLLPLWFVAARRRCPFFSTLANQHIQSVCCLTDSSIDVMNIEGDVNLSDLTIRLTEFSEVVNLSSCPQVTAAVLRQFVWKSGLDGDHLISRQLQPILTFEAVQQVDISKCHRLDIGAAIQCFSKLFPSLRVLRAANLLNFKAKMLYQMMNKCPLVCEIDLTEEISPPIPLEVHFMSSNSEANSSSRVINNTDNVQGGSVDLISPYHSGYSSSNVTKLTIEGRSDIFDTDLLLIATICASLCHINLKGCVSVTDTGISNIITKCFNLHSIIACHTHFGNNSAKALCSIFPVILNGNINTTSVAHKLQTLHIGGCKGVDREFLLQLMPYISAVRSLCLKQSQLDNLVLSSFQGSSLESLNVSNTMISGSHLAYIFLKNPGLKNLKARGCVNLIPRGTNEEAIQSYFCKELYRCLGSSCKLEKIALGWGFCSLALETLRPAIFSLRALTIGVGGSLGEDAFKLLPTTCPLLESLTLYFQCISDLTVLHIIKSLKHLRALSLCLCLGEISIFSFKSEMPCIRKLTLHRVAPSLTNDDLLILAKSCVSLIKLSLSGCGLLSSDAQKIISSEWPGLISLHLEDCGEVTAEGVSSLLDCVALEDLFLRHNGRGIRRNFITDAISKLPMLRLISLDTCDASEGGFDIPQLGASRVLRCMKIARCEMHASSLQIQTVKSRRKTAIHKDTLVVEGGGEGKRVVVKERV